MSVIGQLPGAPRCPNCGRDNDGFGGQDTRPDDGDVSICAYCTNLGLYVVNPVTGDWSIRAPTAAELGELVTDPHVRAALVKVAAINAVRQHLSMFADSMAAEDLWENNPELTEVEADAANELADLIAISVSAGITTSRPPGFFDGGHGAGRPCHERERSVVDAPLVTRRDIPPAGNSV